MQTSLAPLDKTYVIPGQAETYGIPGQATRSVIPAKAGNQLFRTPWIPASAGMTASCVLERRP